MRKVIRVKVVIEREGDGSIHAYCPALKGLHVDGVTEEEACQRASEAIKFYLNSLIQHGEEFPIGADLQVEEIAEKQEAWFPLWLPSIQQSTVSSRAKPPINLSRH